MGHSMTDKEEELEKKISDLQAQIGALTVSYRQLGENIKLLEYLKYVDFIMYRNIIYSLHGNNQEFLDDLVNMALKRWKAEADFALPNILIPEEIRRTLISHVEETEIRMRRELIKIKDKFNEELGDKYE